MHQSSTMTQPQLGCYWFTGLSGAGKTTLATWIKGRLDLAAIRCVILDGDELRKTLNSDLGFDRVSRRENARRIAAVARMFLDSGAVVLVSTIAPFQEDRDDARGRFTHGEFFEVYVTTPFNVCKERDPKGLYAGLARIAQPNFTGHDAPYEAPPNPDFQIVTECRSVAESGAELVEHVMARYNGVLQHRTARLEACAVPA